MAAESSWPHCVGAEPGDPGEEPAVPPADDEPFTS
jgi:hypothetical protein